MKRSIKISLILMGLGLVLGGIGWWNHGDKSIVWQSNTRRLAVAKSFRQNYYPGKYKDIEVDTNLAVTIKRGDTNRVTVQSGVGMTKQPKVSVQKNTLKISSGMPARQSKMIIGGFDNYDRSGVIVTVPATQKLRNVTVKRSSNLVDLEYLKLNQLNIYSGDRISMQQVTTAKPTTIQTTDGNVWVDSLRTPKLNLRSDDGDVTLTNAKIPSRQTHVETLDGDIRVTESELGGGHVGTDDGDIHLLNNRLERRLTVRTGDGDIQAHIAKSAGATLTSQDGDIHVLGKQVANGYRLNPKAKTQYRFDSGDGDVHLSNDN